MVRCVRHQADTTRSAAYNKGGQKCGLCERRGDKLEAPAVNYSDKWRGVQAPSSGEIACVSL